MTVKNYYQMSQEELNTMTQQIMDWMFNNPKSQNYKKVQFAFEVATCAKIIKRTKLTRLVIDTLT